MRLKVGIPALSFCPDGCVLTIGNFDGVHLGHQALLQRLRRQATEMGLPLVVMLFEPQPLEFFRGADAPARLTRLREKLMIFEPFAVDYVIVIPFNQRFSELTAQHFIDEILLHRLKVKYLMVGDDFRFGHQRQGDYALLQKTSLRVGFTLEQMPPVYDAEGHRISSTLIREVLAVGDFAQAERWLGRPYRWCGRVIRGDQRGRELGFPTANLRPHRNKSPLMGVYAVRVMWRGQEYQGVANVGKRPTIGGLQFLLEVHIFEFNQTIYGDFIDVQFEQKIRAERQFPSLDALRQQIQLDQQQAQDYFAATRIPS